MAVLQNLVVNILGNSSSLSRAARSARQDMQSMQGATSNSVASMSAALESPAARAQQLAFAIEKSKRAVVSARAENDALSLSLNNMQIQSHKVLQTSLALDKAILQEAQAGKTLSAVMADEAIQAKQLSLDVARAANALTQKQVVNQQAARAAKDGTLAEIALASAEADMAARSMQAASALRQQSAAMQHFQREGNLSAATAQKFSKELAKGEKAQKALTRSAGMNQMALQQAIFMVEDAASVYGTMGLAGSLRAASNNLTMLAMAFGPWAMAATVAVTTATQLWMALSKGKEKSDDLKKSLEQQRDALSDLNDLLERQITFRHRLARNNDESSMKGEIDERKLNLKVTAAQREELVGRINKLKAQEQHLNNLLANANPEGMSGIMADAGITFGFDIQGQKEYWAGLQDTKDQLKTIQEESKKASQELKDLDDGRLETQKEIAALEERRQGRLKFEKQMAEDRQKSEEITAKMNEREEQRKQAKQQQEAAEKQQKAERESRRSRARASWQLRESTKTPYQKFQDEVNEIRKLREEFPRIVTADVARKGVDAARERLLRSRDQDKDKTGRSRFGASNGVLALRSSEGISAVLQATQGGSSNVAKKQQQHLAKLERLAQEQDKRERARERREAVIAANRERRKAPKIVKY